MQNAEALLFIDHDKSEVFENDVARDEPMRPDNDIDTALAKELQHLLLLPLRAESAKHFDSHRIIEHPLSKDFEVLLSQNGGGGKDRDLFALHDRFKCRANCDFGFTEADVATNEAIH